MGFMDKAKKLAEQAQTKIDDVQKQFNEGGSTSGSSQGPAVEYDQHGRPISAEPSGPPPAAATPPHGDPVGADAPSAPPAAPAPVPDPAAPPAPPDPAAPPAAAPPGPPGGDRNREDYTPPKLTGGDPLAG